MVAVITKDKIVTNAFLNINAYLDNRTYVKDPRYPSSIIKQRKFVYDYDPFLKDFKFGDFPFIVQGYPKPTYQKTSTDGKVKWITWSSIITIRSLRQGAGNSGFNTDSMDIKDDIHAMFNNETVKDALRALGMFEIKFIETDNELLDYEGKTILEGNNELTFMNRLTVSD